MLWRPANSLNPHKVQVSQHQCNVSTRSLDPKDIAARKSESLARQRASGWTENVCEARNRVYQAIAEGHGSVSRGGEAGYDHARVTQSSSPAIVYNRVTQRWERASYLEQVTQPSNIKQVAHAVRQASNAHRGGSF